MRFIGPIPLREEVIVEVSVDSHGEEVRVLDFTPDVPAPEDQPPALENRVHGVERTYKLGCRCEECVIAQRWTWRNRRFRITEAQRQVLWKEHDDKCAICGGEGRLNIDHNHDTGKIRGLLCIRCNTGLGKFKDNEDLLRRAIAYLARTNA